jgi:hypothetical protein
MDDLLSPKNRTALLIPQRNRWVERRERKARVLAEGANTECEVFEQCVHEHLRLGIARERGLDTLTKRTVRRFHAAGAALPNHGTPPRSCAERPAGRE